MRNPSLVALALLISGGSQALADGPDPAVAYRPARHHHAHHATHRRVRNYAASVTSYGEGPATGPSEYREAYIGRGLIYNTPPIVLPAAETVISVRY